MARTKYKKQESGYYFTRVWDGTYVNGKKHYVTLSTSKSSKALEEKVAKFKADVEQRKTVRKSDITFLDYARKWKEVYKGQKSNATQAMYENIIEKHFSVIGDVRLCDIERIHVQTMLNNAAGKIRTQQQIILTFKQVLKSAVGDKLFPSVVMDEIFSRLEPIKYKSGEKRPLTQNERICVFRADFDMQDKIFVYLLYGCGIRREEALGLTIFDFKSGEVNINKAHEFVKNDPRQKSPKTENGYRAIPIPDPIRPVVEAYINHLKESGKTYLFTMQNGKPMTKSSYQKMWERIIKAMQKVSDEKIEGLTAHVFRHNYCTNLCYQIPKISIKKIAQLMGDTEAVVLKVYNHIILEKEDALSAINDAVIFLNEI